MKISCILKTRGIPEDKKKAEWFWQALKSALCFDEVIIHTDDLAGARPLEPFATKIVGDKATVSGGFNQAASFATGDYLTLLCDDDYYNPEHVGILRKTMLRQNLSKADIINFPWYVLDEREIQGVHFPNPIVTADNLINYNLISPAAFIRREIWNKLGGYREIPHCDWDLWARAFAEKASFAHTSIPIYYQRFYATSNYQQTKFTPEQEREIIIRSVYALDRVKV